jgi:3-oxosteroid 1-dehydrogenase
MRRQGPVLDGQDRLIPGLYAAGNATGRPFGLCHPGAGAPI